MQDEPDRDLLRRFAHGDREAFEALFRQFEREVYRWILRIVREPDAAEDALVDAFWRAYRGRARFDPSRSFGAWMRRIATNCALDQLKAARNQRTVQVEDVGQVPLSAETMRSGPATDPALADHIRRAFAALPPKLRIVATMALIEELPQTEIADALGVPIGTVKSRLFRATRELRTELTRAGIQI
ncbi:MAG: RNA polymerase sigma factor [Vicinamibacterales bacterium]